MAGARSTKKELLSPLRQRTRRALVEAALRLFAQKGIGETAIHEIAEEAGVSNGSFYNYFRTREEILEAGAGLLIARYTDQISRSSERVNDPAERVAIGSRRFMLKALEDPEWGAALLRVWDNTPVLAQRVNEAVLLDLRAAKKAKRFSYATERAAVDLLQGTVLAGMRSMVEGGADAGHAETVTAMILRGFGLDAAEAKELATRPLPALPPAVQVTGRKAAKGVKNARP